MSFHTRLLPLHRTVTVSFKLIQRALYSQEPASRTWQDKPTSIVESTVLESLPKVPKRPYLTPVSASIPSEDCKFIVFDLETTGLSHDSDICEIAAMNADSEGSESIWSTYLLPDRSIDKGAQKATGLTTEYFQGKKCLCLHGVPVEALPYKKGIQSFYSYLLQQSSENKHTILLGYGSDRLDVPVLINNFKRHGISCHDLEGIIAGFVDALHLIRKMRGECHPLFVKDGVPLNRSASLGDVYYQLFNTQLTDAHCATADTRGLHRILFQSSLGIKPSQLLDHSSTVSSAYEVADYTSKYLMLLKSMRGRLFNYGDKPRLSITYDDALRIARSGLHYEDLARIYREHGPNGITIVMTSPCDDRPHRVTNNQAIVEAVIQHFQSISGNLVY